MKKLFLLSFFASATASSAFAADNYLISNAWGGASMDMNWSTGSSPTVADDVILDYKYYYETKALSSSSDWDVALWTPYNHVNSKVNSLTIQNLYDPVALKSLSLQITNAANSATGITVTKDMTMVGDSYNSTFRLGVSKVASDTVYQPKIEVGGNLNVGVSTYKDGEKCHFYVGGTALKGGPSSMTVGGNLNIYGGSRFSTNIGTATSGTLSTQDFKVTGVVNMIGSNGTNNPTWYLNSCSTGTDKLNTVVDVGGLNGAGLIRNDTGSLGGSTILILRTASGITTSYSGIIKDDITVGGDSKIALLMAGTGTQILNGEVNISGSSEVKRGTLLTRGNFGNMLISADGTLGAIGAGTQIGTLNVASLTFANNASIIVDFNGASCDLIHANSFSLGNKSNIMNVHFGLTNVQTDVDYKIFECVTLSDSFTAANFKLDEIDGYESSLTISDGNVFVSFTAIPEPATLAAIFGALALAFAAYRRKNS